MSTSRPVAKKVSLADIARRAGVSTNTVSRGSYARTPRCRRRRGRASLSSLRSWATCPTTRRGTLAAKRTNVLQVVLAAPMFHGHGRVLLSILNASSQAGYHVSLSYAYGPDGQLRNDFAPFDVDGSFILGGQDPTIDVAIEAGKRFPTVLVLKRAKRARRHLHRRGRQRARCAPGDRASSRPEGSPTSSTSRVPPAGRTRRCGASATSRRVRPTTSSPWCRARLVGLA